MFLEKFKKTRLAYITVPDKNDLKYKYTASRYHQETDLHLAGVDILGLVGPYTVSSYGLVFNDIHSKDKFLLTSQKLEKLLKIKNLMQKCFCSSTAKK